MRTHKKVTRYFKSKTSPITKVYKTERHRDGKITCTCPGFMYTAVGPNGAHCVHTERAANWK